MVEFFNELISFHGWKSFGVFLLRMSVAFVIPALIAILIGIAAAYLGAGDAGFLIGLVAWVLIGGKALMAAGKVWPEGPWPDSE